MTPLAVKISKASASDPRAAFVSGNVTTCAAAGFPGTATDPEVQVGEAENPPASDANVSGTPAVNSGLTQAKQPGQGEEVNATRPGATAVIDGVVVKGGPAYNVYTTAADLPPALPGAQHFISPFKPGGNVPALSHWFICYHNPPVPADSLTVELTVDDPDGVPTTALPLSYTVVVSCNDGVPPTR
jgi:hypothetical protein